MKYLKTYSLYDSSKKYKLFESSDVILTYFNDILLPLKDEGLSVAVEKLQDDEEYYYLNISASSPVSRKPFSWETIRPYIKHLVSYAREEGFLDVSTTVTCKRGSYNATSFEKMESELPTSEKIGADRIYSFMIYIAPKNTNSWVLDDDCFSKGSTTTD